MSSVNWAIVITISIAGIFLMLNSTPNIANAYSCSSSSSTNGPLPDNTGVSGTTGSCGTSATTSTSAEHVKAGTLVGPNTSSQAVVAIPGIAQSTSSGRTIKLLK